MKFYWLTIGGLGVWRITYALTAEDGPGEALIQLRKTAGQGFWGALLDCFYCLSLWVAVPFAWWLGDDWKEQLMLWPALSAASILLERLSSPRHEDDQAPALYFEAPESDWEDHRNVMLREEERGIADDRHSGVSPKSRL